MNELSYEFEEAVKKAIEESKPRNFTQSIDVIINLKDVDLKNPDNRIKKEVVLPNGRGKEVKVGLFGGESFRMKGKDAGIDRVFDKETAEDMDNSEKKSVAEEIDHFIAQADMMPMIGREWGKVLGPRSKMPDPMPPTVSESELEKTINDLRDTIRLDSGEDPVVHSAVGTEDMEIEDIVGNTEIVLENVMNTYEMGETRIGKIYVKTTMGPTVEVK